jgi:excisionase family DNA binding protein
MNVHRMNVHSFKISRCLEQTERCETKAPEKIRTFGVIQMSRTPMASAQRPCIASPQSASPPTRASEHDVSGILARLAAVEAQLKDNQAVLAQQQERGLLNDLEVKCYTVAETAKILRRGKTRTYQAIVDGKISAIKLGGRWLVPHVALERLLRSELDST